MAKFHAPALLLAALPVLLPVQAMADEMTAAPVVVEDYRWGGAYAGVEAGAVFGNANARRTGHTGDLIELDISNGLFPADIGKNEKSTAATVLAGYNFQNGRLVAGVEVDGTVMNGKRGHAFSRIDPNPGFNLTPTNTTYETDISSYATVRGRLGLALGRTMAYATAGVAYGEVENAFTLGLPLIGYATNRWAGKDYKTGYTVGGGIEYKLTEALNLRFSAQYVDLEDTKILASDPPVFGDNSITYTFDNDFTVLRAGMALAF